MFDKKDKAMIAGLNKILEDATFPLKKREVHSFALVMGWIKELEIKIDQNINEEKKVKTGIKKGSN